MSIGENTDVSAFNENVMSRAPYYDDFSPDKKFLKVLFKPGQNVQARELSQVQSILQNQIQRFGSHIFANGSLVSGGEVTVSNGFFVRVNSTRGLTDTELQSLVGRKITTTDVASDTVATVVSVLGTPTGTPDESGLTNDSEQVVFFDYNTSGVFSGSVFSTTADALPGITFDSASRFGAPVTGNASTIVSVEKGLYYLSGHFCLNDQQTLPAYSITGAYRDFNNPSAAIGFDVLKTIVDSQSDETLNDPASGFNNFNAPGADRFKITPTLAQRTLTGTGDSPSLGISGGTQDYVELVRIDAGTVTRRIKYAEYGDLLRTLARRTFDESGNYTVSPFTLTIDDHNSVYGTVDSTKLGAVLSPGKAYVSGYEFETASPTRFVLDKARETLEIRNETLETPEGLFIRCESDQYNLPTDSTSIEAAKLGVKLLMVSTDNQGNDQIIGTCQFKTFRPEPSNSTTLRFHVQHIEMLTDPDTGRPFNLFGVGSIVFVDLLTTEGAVRDPAGVSLPDGFRTATNLFRFKAQDGSPQIRNLRVGRNIFKIPGTFATKEIKDDLPMKFNTIKMFSGTTDANGVATITLPSGSGEVSFIDTISDFVVMARKGGSDSALTLVPVEDATISVAESVVTIDVSGAGTATDDFVSTEFLVSLPVRYEADNDNRTIRTASLVTTTVTCRERVAGSGEFILDGRDGTGGPVTALYDVISISDGGVDVTEKFTVDDGQRVDLYDFARVKLRSGETINSSEIEINLRKFNFASNNTAAPLTRQSYADVVELETYDKSPVFQDPDTGERLRLYDAIDFRPVRDGTLDRVNYGNFAASYAFDIASDPSIVSYITYLPRIDSLILGDDRILRLQQGVPGPDPKPPTVNDTDLELYQLILSAYTSDDTEVKAKFINSQRFTMQDIGDLEDSTFADQNFIYRSSLQSQAVSAALGLFPGSESVDSGVFVDDFRGHAFADVTKPQHNCSIDPVDTSLRLPFQTFNRSVTCDVSQNAQLFDTPYGRILTAAGSTIAYLKNSRSTGSTLAPNPFGVVDHLGSLKLSPSFDRYWSETKAPKVLVNAAGENNAWVKALSAPTGVAGKRFGFGTQWKDWESIWFGRTAQEDVSLDSLSDPDNNRYFGNVSRSAFVQRTLAEKITKKIGNKIIDLSVIPYMDAQTIKFRAEGCKPGATHYVYFDGELVGATADGYVAGVTGAFEDTVVIPADTYLTGEKIVRVSDGLTTGDITTATSSADASFYALGNYETIRDGVESVRPPIKRRDAVNTESFLGAEYLDSLGGLGVNVFNALDPLAQTFTVDTSKNNGLCLDTVRLLFTEKPEAEGSVITVQIRPVDGNGTPRRNFVIPFAEKTLAPSDVNIDGAMTDFTFDAPVYLSPGEYAICVITNDSGYHLRTRSQTDDVRLNSLFVSRNDGERTVLEDTYLYLEMYRHTFTANQTTKIACELHSSFDTDITGNRASAFYFANARNVLSSADITAKITTAADDITGPVNTTLNATNQSSCSNPTAIELSFLPVADVSPIIDQDQCKILNINQFSSSIIDQTSEEDGNDEKSSSIAKYYSKIVSLETRADNLNVRLSGVFPSDAIPQVFVKTGGGTKGPLADQQYVKLVIQEGIQNSIGRQVVVKNFAATTGQNPDNPAASDLGTFTEYQIKIVMPNRSNDNNKDLPIITGLNAVALGKKTQAAFFNTITPIGTILMYAGNARDNCPEGFLPCDGRILPSDVGGEDEFDSTPLRNLLLDAGNPFGIGTTDVRLPDMRGRVAVGSSEDPTDGLPATVLEATDKQKKRTAGTSSTEPSIFDARVLGNVGGTQLLQAHDHRSIGVGGNSVRVRLSGDQVDEGALPGEGTNSGGEGGGKEDRPRMFATGGNNALLAGGGSNAQRVADRIITRNLGTGANGQFVEYESDTTIQETMPPHLVCHYIIKL